MSRIHFLKSLLTISFLLSATAAHAQKFDDTYINVNLPKKKYQGEEAIQVLGDKNLDEMAKHYKTTGEKLKSLFRNDSSLRIDHKAHLYYAEENLPSGSVLGDGSIPNNPAANQIPESETFKLHSKPSNIAGKVYLNFLGKSVRSSVWNGGTAFTVEAYNKDGVAGFSSDEMTQIRSMWLAVSEDYAAFNLDVTTEPPTAADYHRFIEIIITPTNQWYGSGNGGICYVGSFTWNDPANQTCFVFSALLGNGTKYIQEAISHESGHAFGLNHWSKWDTATKTLIMTYSTGQDNWAPIMGNSYYAGVTTWSKGEYAGAGLSYGYGTFQDDLAIISNIAGVGYAVDEAPGDTRSQAILKQTVSNGIAVIDHMGIISNASDVDVYRIDATAAGLHLNISPAGYSPNLDFKVELLNAAGQLAIDPATALPELNANPNSINFVSYNNDFLPSGTYYLRITPSGYLNNSASDSYATGYSSYGSNGQYQVTGSYSSGGVAVLQPPSQLSYASASSVYMTNSTIAANSPSSSGGAVSAYSVTPGLPSGIALNSQTGIISGTPQAAQNATNYTVTASNSAGSTSAIVTIEVQAQITPPPIVVTDVLIDVPTQVSINKNLSIQAVASGSSALSSLKVYINNSVACTFANPVVGKIYICTKRIKDSVGSNLSIKADVTSTSGATTPSTVKQVLVVR